MDIINDILPGLEGAPAEVVVEPDRRAAIRAGPLAGPGGGHGGAGR